MPGVRMAGPNLSRGERHQPLPSLGLGFSTCMRKGVD